MAEEVLIGCKLSNGLILELIAVPSKDLARQLQPSPTGPRVTLKGANSLRTNLKVSQGEHPFAVTRVDKAFWDAWYAHNKNLDFVRKGLVFVAESEKDAKAMARERMPEKTGLEPMNPEIKKEPRLPNGNTPQTTVEADPEALSKALTNAPRS